MGHGGRDMRRRAVRAATVGLLVVTGYVVVGALQILVWNPLAAVPGATLGEIHWGLAQANETMATPLVLAWAAIGTALAAAVLRAAGRGSISGAQGVVLLDLLIIALAAPSHWFASFPAGMGIADTFATTGGAHTPWGMVLYGVSAAALVALIAGLLLTKPAGRVGRENTAR